MFSRLKIAFLLPSDESMLWAMTSKQPHYAAVQWSTNVECQLLITPFDLHHPSMETAILYIFQALLSELWQSCQLLPLLSLIIDEIRMEIVHSLEEKKQTGYF